MDEVVDKSDLHGIIILARIIVAPLEEKCDMFEDSFLHSVDLNLDSRSVSFLLDIIIFLGMFLELLLLKAWIIISLVSAKSLFKLSVSILNIQIHVSSKTD